tara:strand:- start:49316 stop:60436 length:11121 start_codon:yes stop_codon:yes gene_type:complete
MNDFHKKSLTSLLFEEKEEKKQEIKFNEDQAVPLNKVEKVIVPRLVKQINKKANNIAQGNVSLDLKDSQRKKIAKELKIDLSDVPKNIYKPLNSGLGVVNNRALINRVYCSSKVSFGKYEISLAPFDVKGEQTQDIDPVSLQSFIDSQMLVFHVVIKSGKESVALGAQSQSGKSSSYVVVLPPLHAKIKEDNLSLHKLTFDLKDGHDVYLEYNPSEGGNFKVIQLSEESDHVSQMQDFLKNQKTSAIKNIATKQSQLKGTVTLSPESDKKEQKDSSTETNESFSLQNMHKSSLKSLLFEQEEQETPELQSTEETAASASGNPNRSVSTGILNTFRSLFGGGSQESEQEETSQETPQEEQNRGEIKLPGNIFTAYNFQKLSYMGSAVEIFTKIAQDIHNYYRGNSPKPANIIKSLSLNSSITNKLYDTESNKSTENTFAIKIKANNADYLVNRTNKTTEININLFEIVGKPFKNEQGDTNVIYYLREYGSNKQGFSYWDTSDPGSISRQEQKQKIEAFFKQLQESISTELIRQLETNILSDSPNLDLNKVKRIGVFNPALLLTKGSFEGDASASQEQEAADADEEYSFSNIESYIDFLKSFPASKLEQGEDITLDSLEVKLKDDKGKDITLNLYNIQNRLFINSTEHGFGDTSKEKLEEYINNPLIKLTSFEYSTNSTLESEHVNKIIILHKGIFEPEDKAPAESESDEGSLEAQLSSAYKVIQSSKNKIEAEKINIPRDLNGIKYIYCSGPESNSSEFSYLNYEGKGLYAYYSDQPILKNTSLGDEDYKKLLSSLRNHGWNKVELLEISDTSLPSNEDLFSFINSQKIAAALSQPFEEIENENLDIEGENDLPDEIQLPEFVDSYNLDVDEEKQDDLQDTLLNTAQSVANDKIEPEDAASQLTSTIDALKDSDSDKIFNFKPFDEIKDYVESSPTDDHTAEVIKLLSANKDSIYLNLGNNEYSINDILNLLSHFILPLDNINFINEFFGALFEQIKKSTNQIFPDHKLLFDHIIPVMEEQIKSPANDFNFVEAVIKNIKQETKSRKSGEIKGEEEKEAKEKIVKEFLQDLKSKGLGIFVKADSIDINIDNSIYALEIQKDSFKISAGSKEDTYDFNIKEIESILKSVVNRLVKNQGIFVSNVDNSFNYDGKKYVLETGKLNSAILKRLAAWVENDDFYDLVDIKFKSKKEVSGKIKDRVLEEVENRAKALEAIPKNIAKDIEGLFSGKSGEIDLTQSKENVVNKIKAVITARSTQFNQINSYLEDERFFTFIYDQIDENDSDESISRVIKNYFEREFTPEDIVINSDDLVIDIDNKAFKTFVKYVARSIFKNYKPEQQDIVKDDISKVLVSAYQDITGFGSGNVMIESNVTVKNKNLLNERLLKEGVGEFLGQLKGVYVGKAVGATLAALLGVTGFFTTLPFIIGGAMIGGALISKAGKFLDKTPLLNNLNVSLVALGKAKSDAETFQALIKEPTITDPLRDILKELVRVEIGKTLVKYFILIEEVLKESNINLNIDDIIGEYEFDENAIRNEIEKDKTYQDLNKEAETFLDAVYDLPYEISKNMGPAYKNVRGATSKALMKNVIENSSILSEIFRAYALANKNEKKPLQAGFVYKKGLRALLTEQEEEAKGYLSKKSTSNVRKYKIEEILEDIQFDIVKEITKLFDFTQDGIEEFEKYAIKRDFLQNRGEAGFVKNKLKTIGLDMTKAFMKKSHVITTLAKVTGIPQGKINKLFESKNQFKPVIAGVSNQNLVNPLILEEELFLGNLSSMLFENTRMPSVKRKSSSNRKSKKRRQSKNYLSENVLRGSLASLLFEEQTPPFDMNKFKEIFNEAPGDEGLQGIKIKGCMYGVEEVGHSESGLTIRLKAEVNAETQHGNHPKLASAGKDQVITYDEDFNPVVSVSDSDGTNAIDRIAHNGVTVHLQGDNAKEFVEKMHSSLKDTDADTQMITGYAELTNPSPSLENTLQSTILQHQKNNAVARMLKQKFGDYAEDIKVDARGVELSIKVATQGGDQTETILYNNAEINEKFSFEHENFKIQVSDRSSYEVDTPTVQNADDFFPKDFKPSSASDFKLEVRNPKAVNPKATQGQFQSIDDEIDTSGGGSKETSSTGEGSKEAGPSPERIAQEYEPDADEMEDYSDDDDLEPSAQAGSKVNVQQNTNISSKPEKLDTSAKQTQTQQTPKAKSTKPEPAKQTQQQTSKAKSAPVKQDADETAKPAKTTSTSKQSVKPSTDKTSAQQSSSVQSSSSETVVDQSPPQMTNQYFVKDPADGTIQFDVSKIKADQIESLTLKDIPKGIKSFDDFKFLFNSEDSNAPSLSDQGRIKDLLNKKLKALFNTKNTATPEQAVKTVKEVVKVEQVGGKAKATIKADKPKTVDQQGKPVQVQSAMQEEDIVIEGNSLEEVKAQLTDTFKKLASDGNEFYKYIMEKIGDDVKFLFGSYDPEAIKAANTRIELARKDVEAAQEKYTDPDVLKVKQTALENAKKDLASLKAKTDIDNQIANLLKSKLNLEKLLKGNSETIQQEIDDIVKQIDRLGELTKDQAASLEKIQEEIRTAIDLVKRSEVYISSENNLEGLNKKLKELQSQLSEKQTELQKQTTELKRLQGENQKNVKLEEKARIGIKDSERLVRLAKQNLEGAQTDLKTLETQHQKDLETVKTPQEQARIERELKDKVSQRDELQAKYDAKHDALAAKLKAAKSNPDRFKAIAKQLNDLKENEYKPIAKLNNEIENSQKIYGEGVRADARIKDYEDNHQIYKETVQRLELEVNNKELDLQNAKLDLQNAGVKLKGTTADVAKQQGLVSGTQGDVDQLQKDVKGKGAEVEQAQSSVESSKGEAGAKSVFGDDTGKESLAGSKEKLADALEKLQKFSNSETIRSSGELKEIGAQVKVVKKIEGKIEELKSKLQGADTEEARSIAEEIEGLEGKVESAKTDLNTLLASKKGFIEKAGEEIQTYVKSVTDYVDNVSYHIGHVKDEMTSLLPSSWGQHTMSTGAFSVKGALLDMIPVGIWGYKAFKKASQALKENTKWEDIQASLSDKDNNIFAYGFATPIAYSICNLLNENKEALKALGFDISGQMPQGRDSGNIEGSESFGEVSALFSQSMHDEMKETIRATRQDSFLGRMFGSDKVTDEDLVKAMEDSFRESVSDVVVALVLSYDRRTSEKIQRKTNKNISNYNRNSARLGNITRKSGGFLGKYGGGTLATVGLYTAAAAAVGTTGGLFIPLLAGAAGAYAGGNVGEAIGRTGLGEMVSMARESRSDAGDRDFENVAKKDPKIKKDVNKIIGIAKSIAKKAKDMQESFKAVHKNKLSTLLLEESSTKTVTVSDIKKKLKASNVSIYRFLRQSDPAFKSAEDELCSVVVSILSQYFGIEIPEAPPVDINKLRSQAVAKTTTNGEAAPGEINNPTVHQNFRGIPSPASMNDPANPAQLIHTMAYSGGGNMQQVLTLFIEQQKQMQDFLMKMTEKQMSLGQVSKELTEMPGAKFDNLEEAMGLALKTINGSKPLMMTSTARAIFFTLKSQEFRNKIKEVQGVESIDFDKDFLDESIFVGTLKQSFNLTKKQVNYDDSVVKPLKDIVGTIIKIKINADSVKDEFKIKSQANVQLRYYESLLLDLIASKILQVNMSPNNTDKDYVDHAQDVLKDAKIIEESARRKKVIKKNYYNKKISDLLFEDNSYNKPKYRDKKKKLSSKIDLQEEWRKIWLDK